MDFMNFVKEMEEQYGTTDADWEPLKRAAVVRFDYDEKNNLSGQYNRKFVYPDWNHTADIRAGEIWLVTLTENPKTYANYFAKPLRKIDASFLYEMNKDQLDSLALFLWNENRTILEPFLEEKYREIMNDHIAKAVEERTDELMRKIAELGTELETLRKIGEEDKMIIQSNEDRIQSLNAEIAALRKGAPAAPVPVSQPSQEVFCEEIRVPRVVIERSGPDSLTSESFNKSRYFVHLSADHRMMLIREDKNGTVICLDSTLILSGLSSILPYNEGDVLQAEYSNRFGGIVVSLE